MKYPKGRNFEVIIREHGFEDSYYNAKILSYSRRKGYFVEFKTLLEDNERDPSRKYVDEKDIGPLPKQLSIGDFAPEDIVDADVRDGWWVGKVLRKAGDMYAISFNRGTEELILKWTALRLHQEFDGDGDIWFYTKK